MRILVTRARGQLEIDVVKTLSMLYEVIGLGKDNLNIVNLDKVIDAVKEIKPDFIFDGEKKEPYLEFDRANPLCIYGKSKLAGEDLIKEICQDTIY